MDRFTLMDAFLPIGGICYDIAYLTRQKLCRDHFFPPVIIQANRELVVYRTMISRHHHLLDCLTFSFAYSIVLVTSVNVG
jgi:hypothetical protein